MTPIPITTKLPNTIPTIAQALIPFLSGSLGSTGVGMLLRKVTGTLKESWSGNGYNDIL